MNSNKLRVVEPDQPLTAREEAREAIKRYNQYKHTPLPEYRTPWVEEPEHVNPLPVDEILRRSEPNYLVGKK